MNLSTKLRNELDQIINRKRPSEEAMSLIASFDDEILQWQHEKQAGGNPVTMIDEVGGVNILLNCMTVLSNNGTLHCTRDERYSDCYEAIRSLCWNASDRSLEFCDQCGECGLLDFLANELRNLKNKFTKDSKMSQSLVYSGFAILMNCSKSVNNIEIMDDLDVTSLATEYIEIIKSKKFSNSMDLEMCCSILLAYTMDEDSLPQSDDLDDVIEYLVQNLNVALSKPDHRFSGYHADELISAIQKFAKNEKNGLKVVEEFNDFEIFSIILKEGFSFRGEEKLAMLSLLCQLSFFDKLRKKITENKKIMQFLRETSGRESNRNNKERQMARLTLLVLESNSKKLPDRSLSEGSASVSKTSLKKISNRSLSESSAPTTSRGTENIKHIVLSFEKQSRALAVQIKSDLQLHYPSCDVYLEGDDDYSDESLSTNEIKTFQQSDASLLLLTKRYQNSLHCRAVAEFLTSSTTRKTMLLFKNPLLTSSGWMKSILDHNVIPNCIEMKETYEEIKNQVHESLFGIVRKYIQQPIGDNESYCSDYSDDFEDDDNHSQKTIENNDTETRCLQEASSDESCSSTSPVQSITPAEKHIMISYQHSYQNVADQIRNLLHESGYKVWMDKYDIKGDITNAMMDAIENSEFFIMCWSEEYQRSPVCRKEAEYADDELPRNRLIPIIVQEGYQPKRWIAFHFRSLVYYKISSGYDAKIHSKIVLRLKEEKKKI